MRRFVQAFAPEALPHGLEPATREALAGFEPRYNIATRTCAAVIHAATQGAGVGDFQWGLVPRWSAKPETRYTTVTARLERAPSSRIFQSAWRERRCVVPMTGYYKWDRSSPPAWPYFIQACSGETLFAAGLWECWEKEEPGLCSFAILTHRNVAIPSPLVPDGPLFMPAARIREWLAGPLLASRFLTGMKQPALEAYPVSRRVRDAKVDDYTLLEPVERGSAANEPTSFEEDPLDDEDE